MVLLYTAFLQSGIQKTKPIGSRHHVLLIKAVNSLELEQGEVALVLKEWKHDNTFSFPCFFNFV